MSVDKTLEERGSRYGTFIEHAAIAQALQDVIRNTPKWEGLDVDMKQALVVFTDKIARILNGDPKYLDNWHDIQGYARLVEARLQADEDSIQELFKQELTVPDSGGYIHNLHPVPGVYSEGQLKDE